MKLKKTFTEGMSTRITITRSMFNQYQQLLKVKDQVDAIVLDITVTEIDAGDDNVRATTTLAIEEFYVNGNIRVELTT